MATRSVPSRWESFIIRLDILRVGIVELQDLLRIFHYSPWYTYQRLFQQQVFVENLSLFALIYLGSTRLSAGNSWESFIIRLDILIGLSSGWREYVENLSLFALIYLFEDFSSLISCWESFIIRLDILTANLYPTAKALRIFHYSPWYTYSGWIPVVWRVENLSLFALIYLHSLLPWSR